MTLDIITTILGLLYILLEYKASIWLWLVGIIMPALDIILYYQHGLYGDSAMAAYYMIAAIYGWIAWRWFSKKGGNADASATDTQENSSGISRMPSNKYLPALLFFIIAWAATYWVLANYTDSTVPVLDAFTNALSFIGLWALAKKYIEQWLFWIVVDVIACYLYIIKGIPFKAMLYGLYVIIAVAGYFKWKKIAPLAPPLRGDDQPSQDKTNINPLPLRGEDGRGLGGSSSLFLIIANGEFPTSPKALSVIDDASYICCCDGAAEKLLAYGRVPDAIVGDGDSLSAELREKFKDILHTEAEQEYNDLTKATRFCIAKGAKSIVYLGATGLREDHTLGNISLLFYYQATYNIAVSMVTDYGIFQAYRKGTTVFPAFPGQQISIFNNNCTTISAEGLRYKPYAFTQLWQGTLNEALADSFSITADGDYLIYKPHPNSTND